MRRCACRRSGIATRGSAPSSYSRAISSSSISILLETTGLPSPSCHHRVFRRRSVAVTPLIALALAPSIACHRLAVRRHRAAAAVATTATTLPPSFCRRRTVALPPPLLPSTPRCRQAAADVAQLRCRGWCGRIRPPGYKLRLLSYPPPAQKFDQNPILKTKSPRHPPAVSAQTPSSYV